LPAVVVGGSSAPLAPSVSTIPSIQVLSTPHVSAPAPASTPNVSTPAPASTPNTSTGAPSWQTWALIGGAVAGMGLFAIALHEKANGGRNKN
jgi:hypothetical protein